MHDRTYAAIDIGSNAVRLLIGQWADREGRPRIKKILSLRLPIRLGGEVFTSGVIGSGTADRLMKGLQAFRLLAEVHGAGTLRCVATSALRTAHNRDVIVERAKAEAGVSVDVIDGATEALLIIRAVRAQGLLPEGDHLFVDVGGGSTELAWIHHGDPQPPRSFRLGTLHPSPVPEWESLIGYLREIRANGRSMTAIGTGGNLDRIFKESGKKRGEPLRRREIREQRDRIASFSMAERVTVLGLPPDRADVIVPAADILLRVLDEAGINEVVVPKVGLVNGIMYDLYGSAVGDG